MKPVRRQVAAAAVLCIGVLLLAGLIIALASSNPSWTPAAPFTNDTLRCAWATSGDTIAQNITLLRNGALYNTSYENASLGVLNTSVDIPASATARGEKWTCRITLINETASLTHDVNVTILNSPPATEGMGAGIFNSSGVDVGYLVQILEDSVMSLDVNATDPDNDVLTYLQADEFCTRNSSANGTYTCAPTQANLILNSPTSINITFTASDGQNVGGRTITFNITPVNDAPVALLTNQTTPVNLSLNYTFAVTDEENNVPYSFSLSAPAEIADKLSVAKTNANGTQASIYYDAAMTDYNDIGVWTINVMVTDNSTSAQGTNNSRTGTYNLTLNITPVGRRPYFTNITPAGPYQLAQGQFLQINLSANDPDANSTLMFLADTVRFVPVTTKADTNTSDARGQINFTPTNDDVGVYNVTLTVRDGTTLTNTTVLRFNVTNVNDAPLMYLMSYSGTNTQSNRNASNLTGFANTLFIYDVNATDPDIIYGDAINYSSNSTLFTINATTGRISFTPADAQIGTHIINVTVTDAVGARASMLLNLSILANRPPYFNATAPQINCTTKAVCFANFSSIAADPDAGDSVETYNITLQGGNLTSLAYNASTGVINFTTLKTDMGNYTLNVTIIDTHGALNWTLVNLSINNTPEAPNITRYDFGGQMIVETHPLTYELRAIDDDFLLPLGENVTFSTNTTLNHTLVALARQNETARAMLTLLPGLGDAGNYTITINATDRYGLVASKNVTFTIYGKVPPPEIQMITPWGLNGTNELQSGFVLALPSQFPNNTARVRFAEGIGVLFNLTVVDSRPLNYSWTVNGTPVSSATSYLRAFDYFSNGTYNVTVNISNDRLESTQWTWLLTVVNNNRAPVLVGPLASPILVNGTITYSDYFTLNNGTKFFDPDDDLDSSGTINGAENNTLTFASVSACGVAVLTAEGPNLRVMGTEVGGCQVIFNATDRDGASTQSNLVAINVTDIPQGSAPTPTPISSGGGGSSSTTSTFVPITKRVEKPQAFSIIAPKLVTIYQNKTLEIPVVINNTWTSPLKMVRLAAQTNATGVKARFDVDLFEEIPVNQSREVTLSITNYRLGANYEVMITGNVSDPDYSDQALVLLNSIEQSGDGDDVKVKVTFANDLLNEHPECQELNEVLSQAKQKIDDGNLDEGTRMVESVISGCKYLVSTQQRIQEKPGRLNPVINIDDISVKSIMIGMLSFVVLASIAFLIYYHYSHKPEDDI